MQSIWNSTFLIFYSSFRGALIHLKKHQTSKNLNGLYFLTKLYISIDMTFFATFFYRTLQILFFLTSTSKPGYVSKCQNFLWGWRSSFTTVLPVKPLEWGMIADLCNHTNKPKFTEEGKKVRKRKKERNNSCRICSEHVLNSSSICATALLQN